MCKAFYLEIGFWKSKLCLIVPQGPEALADMPDMARLHWEAPASASDSQAAASVGEQAGAVPPPTSPGTRTGGGLAGCQAPLGSAEIPWAEIRWGIEGAGEGQAQAGRRLSRDPLQV